MTSHWLRRALLTAAALLPALALLPAIPSFAQAQRAPAQRSPAPRPIQPRLGTRLAPVIEHDGLRFRDLNRSGRLEPYEDWRLTPEARARDLAGRMTLAEKAGTMMHGTIRSVGPMGRVGVGTEYDLAENATVMRELGISAGITRLGGSPSSLAEQHNKLQEAAEATRLGIPFTVSTDPRHHFQFVLGASVQSGRFSQWPEPLGFAALRDPALMRRFADIARQEYRAVGIHMTLSPQADLATEPRWSRINGTFGEDADLAGSLVTAYVEGFQHGRRGADSSGVLAIVKHWVGYGASKDGYDGHNYYGRYAPVSGNAFAYHVRPFLGAFAANVSGVMPTYAILPGAAIDGKPLEQVGAAFNTQLLDDLLRTHHRFTGIVLTDWAVTNDCNANCRNGVASGERPSFTDVAMPWGVEDLPRIERFAKAVNAGVDQFGGTEDAAAVVEGVKAGRFSEARLDRSVVRIMAQKFALGLFENPFVDPAVAQRVVGNTDFRAAALDAQRRALVLLENKAGLVPLGSTRKRIFLHKVDPLLAATYGWRVVNDPAEADVAIMRLDAPFETLHPGWVFGAMQHEGNLAFRDGDTDFERFKDVSAKVPTIVTVYLDRPAILTPLKERAKVLLANFGVTDAALLDVVAGRDTARGRLPFALPSSMESVLSQRGDRAHDLRRPLYRFGAGIVR